VGAAWSASPKSAAPAKRSAGTRASARWIAASIASGTACRCSRTLGGASVSRRAIIACAVGPVNGVSPASIS
jgi:hypothetical protein